MQEIKVYLNPLRYVLVCLLCAFLSLGLLHLLANDAEGSAVSVFLDFVMGFLAAVFVMLLAWVLYVKIKRIPFLKIYDDRVESYLAFKRTYQVIRYEDVFQFRLTDVMQQKIIAVDYRKEAFVRRTQELSQSKSRRFALQSNSAFAGAADTLNAANLSMKPRELCLLLNERLHQWHQNHPDTHIEV